MRLPLITRLRNHVRRKYKSHWEVGRGGGGGREESTFENFMMTLFFIDFEYTSPMAQRITKKKVCLEGSFQGLAFSTVAVLHSGSWVNESKVCKPCTGRIARRAKRAACATESCPRIQRKSVHQATMPRRRCTSASRRWAGDAAWELLRSRFKPGSSRFKCHILVTLVKTPWSRAKA